MLYSWSRQRVARSLLRIWNPRNNLTTGIQTGFGIDGLVDQLFAAVMLTGREPMSSRASNAPPMWSTHLAFGLL